MRTPLVSVIIPCWNAEDFVSAAIQSAFQQTYSLVEVIVIDDGSTDGSLRQIQTFDESITWVSGANQKGGAARNKGLQLAKGELIQFLDADDRLLRERLNKLVPEALAAGPGFMPICN